MSFLKKILVLLGFIIFNFNVNAGGFSLYTEGSASAVGNYAAGIAAEGRDASVGWYNPAALVMLKKKELIVGGVGVMPTANLSGTASFYQLEPGYLDQAPYVYSQSFSKIDGGREAIVPNLHLALPYGEKLVFGMSLVSPLGLSTNWSEDSALRYAGTLSSLRVIDFSPEFGWLVQEHISVGAGVDFQWLDVNFDNVLGAPAALQHLDQNPTAWDSRLQNHGKGFGTGFHAGLLFKFDEDRTRFGFNYAYSVSPKFTGTSSLYGILADENLENPNASYIGKDLYTNHISFPDILTFSIYQQVNDKVALMGSIVYSLWSPFNKIVLNNVVAFSAEENQIIQTSGTAIQNFQNAVRAAVGINYNLTEHWQFRLGGGYDQTPTNNIDRDVRLPDVDKLAIAVGARWRYDEHLGFDVGYSYLLPTDNVLINKTQILDQYNWVGVQANGHAYAQLFAAQFNWRG